MNPFVVAFLGAFVALFAFSASSPAPPNTQGPNRVPKPNPQNQLIFVNGVAGGVTLFEGDHAVAIYSNFYLPEDDDCDTLYRWGNTSYHNNWVKTEVVGHCKGCTKQTYGDGLCNETLIIWNGTGNGPWGQNIYANFDANRFGGLNTPVLAAVNWIDVPPQGGFFVNRTLQPFYSTTYNYNGTLSKSFNINHAFGFPPFNFWNGQNNAVDDSPYNVTVDWGNGDRLSTNLPYTYVPGTFPTGNYYSVVGLGHQYMVYEGLGLPHSVTYNGTVTVVDKDQSVLNVLFQVTITRPNN